MLGPILDWDKGTARVPLEIHGETSTEKRFYKVNVGHDSLRYFYDETLPAVFKQRLAVINSLREWGEDDYKSQSPYTYIFNTNLPAELQDIGWKINVNKYCVVIPITELAVMKGVKCDTRSQSQKESERVS